MHNAFYIKYKKILINVTCLVIIRSEVLIFTLTMDFLVDFHVDIQLPYGEKYFLMEIYGKFLKVFFKYFSPHA